MKATKIELYDCVAKGMTTQDIALMFGYADKKAIATRLRGLGLKANPIMPEFDFDKWAERIKDKTNGSFVLIGPGQTNERGEKTLRIRCSVHADYETFISSQTLRPSKMESSSMFRCPICKKAERINKKIVNTGKAHRLVPKIKGQQEFKICKCGTFLLPEQRICDQCKQQRAKETDRKKETKRRMRCKGGDWSISLKDLYERDQGICYLCGCRCDWRDGKWKDGAFIVGPTYPSIEHVIPLSKGGTHEWNNVKLACWICNTRKGAR